MKLEAVVIAVSDVDRAKKFYEGLGWRLDADLGGGDFRIVQLNPRDPTAAYSSAPASRRQNRGRPQNLLVVADIEAAYAAIADHGAEVSEVFHDKTGGYNRFAVGVRASGPDPERRTYASFMEFRDPDGNVWQLQEITSRLPGRVDSRVATFTSVDGLAKALRRAEAAHGEHEARTGERDEDWPTWYAAFMLAEQTGDELPS